MNKDIVNCIAVGIQNQRKKEEYDRLLKTQKEKDHQQEQKMLVKEIKDFFSNLPKTDYKIKIGEYVCTYKKDFWGRDTDIIESSEIISLIPTHPNSKFIGYTYMYILFKKTVYEYDESILDIGFNNKDYVDNIYDCDLYLYDDGSNHWFDNDKLKHIRDNLGWFENELAKQYGCSSD